MFIWSKIREAGGRVKRKAMQSAGQNFVISSVQNNNYPQTIVTPDVPDAHVSIEYTAI